MPLIIPFRALRPAPGRAYEVAAPPYDVMNAEEARRLVKGKPWSFLHISRPEVDLPVGTNPYAPEVYAKAAENLQLMLDQGVLVQDQKPGYYVYRLTMGAHVQTGLVAAASVQAYDTNRIKKHEFTRPGKEDDRVRQVEALDAQTGPVLLVYPSQTEVNTILAETTATKSVVDITPDDGVRHQLWVLNDEAQVASLSASFEAMDSLYVADGHHRSAAASRVAAGRKQANAKHQGDEVYNYFLSVIFPHDQMQILDYNRVIRELNGLDEEEFLSKVTESFDLQTSDTPVKPKQPAQFGMYLSGRWYRLDLYQELVPKEDPVARLDVSLLADNLIDKVLGISDPRRDDRIDFVGGIRGLEGLEARVNSGEMKLAFSLYPTQMEDLMAVADSGEVMPPKSTWFEPKLADGLASHLLGKL